MCIPKTVGDLPHPVTHTTQHHSFFLSPLFSVSFKHIETTHIYTTTQSGDGIRPCQFPSWDLDGPVDFHHATNRFPSNDSKPEPLYILWPQLIPINFGLENRYLPHHHLTMWATSMAHWCYRFRLISKYSSQVIHDHHG